jgi:hypothetical protein
MDTPIQAVHRRMECSVLARVTGVSIEPSMERSEMLGMQVRELSSP